MSRRIKRRNSRPCQFFSMNVVNRSRSIFFLLKTSQSLFRLQFIFFGSKYCGSKRFFLNFFPSENFFSQIFSALLPLAYNKFKLNQLSGAAGVKVTQRNSLRPQRLAVRVRPVHSSFCKLEFLCIFRLSSICLFLST